MSADLPQQIERFRSLAGGNIQVVGRDILRFTPANPSGLKVGILGLVHGNEVIGIHIINDLLADLSSGKIKVKHEIYLGLGNLPAAHASQRFIDKDLNRCFGQKTSSTPEEVRARELETGLLDHVDYLIDIHQTVQPTQKPFFIFQYSSPDCFQKLAMMNPGLDTILQFEAIGDSQSLSTDEYLRSRGGFGVALELSELGYNPEAFQLGRSICRGFLNNLNTLTQFDVKPRYLAIVDRVLSLQDGTQLDAQWVNFTKFEKGQVMGTADGLALIANRSGHILFPKLSQSVAREGILFHVVEPMNAEELARLSRSSIPQSPAQDLANVGLGKLSSELNELGDLVTR